MAFQRETGEECVGTKRATEARALKRFVRRRNELIQRFARARRKRRTGSADLESLSVDDLADSPGLLSVSPERPDEVRLALRGNGHEEPA